MALARDLSIPAAQEAEIRRCLFVRDSLIQDGLYRRADAESGALLPQGIAGTTWRLAPSPFQISNEDAAFFQALGDALLAFYQALNRLYAESARGQLPAWVAGYLDQGKPDSLIGYARMKRFREALPAVIRPDVIPTEDGMIITELDSVPGGIGLTAAMSLAYGTMESSDAGGPLVGGPDGLLRAFASMLRRAAAGRPGGCVIVVSEEAKDYRPEMNWLADRLRATDLEVWCAAPRDLRFTEESLFVATPEGERPVAVIYRFFELFDLPNVPKAELVMYSAKKNRVSVTPPFKPALEEKLAFALFHHPILEPFWEQHLSPAFHALLGRVIPKTWVLDPHPLPPSAVIPGLRIDGHAIAAWDDLKQCGQKDRQYAVKPSGFSELAWGSRGVSVGHDLAQAEWGRVLDTALASFGKTPYVLQEFHKGRRYELSYYDESSGQITPMSGRVRLSPYYFVAGDRAELAGILATVCTPEKKLIHGMRDAVMGPCVVAASPHVER